MKSVNIFKLLTAMSDKFWTISAANESKNFFNALVFDASGTCFFFVPLINKAFIAPYHWSFRSTFMLSMYLVMDVYANANLKKKNAN